MKDTVHTNKQRIEKIRSVFDDIDDKTAKLREKNGRYNVVVCLFESLNEAAKEAVGSLDAIESFLDDRNALDRID